MFNIPLTQFLAASAVLAILGVSSFVIAPGTKETTVIYLTPKTGTTVVGESFVVNINVKSDNPVNVFNGELTFDDEILSIQRIDYNTSIANLWAEEPWFSNGDGTLNFTGGTTIPGGFTGDGSLITITFNAIKTGEAFVTMSKARILKHDGLGTDVPLLQPIDAIFAVNKEIESERIIEQKSISGPVVTVIESKPDTDLNNDGRQTIADISIFMADLTTQNKRSDFNQDGVVNLKDLSILTQ